MKLRIGPGFCTLRRLPSHPHWKIATTTPNDANTERRKPSAALSGTSTERNTIMSRMIDSPTTIAPNGMSAPVSRFEMSIPTAVAPVTEMGVLYCLVMSGPMSRMDCTRALVCGASGALDGMTWMIAVSRPASGSP